MKNKTIIAIDPGKSGGIATFGNNKINVVKMPKDVNDIQMYLKTVLETYENPVVFIEKVQAYRGKSFDELKEDFIFLYEKFTNKEQLFEEVKYLFTGEDDAPGKKFGINKMLANYTELLTIIRLLNIPFIEVYPVSWQSTLGLKIPKEKITKAERKNRYKQFAERSFPELGKLNLAVSDAVCLVQFALKKYETDIDWIYEKTQSKKKNDLF